MTTEKKIYQIKHVSDDDFDCHIPFETIKEAEYAFRNGAMQHRDRSYYNIHEFILSPTGRIV